MRPLSIDEIQQLLLLAREGEWWGDPKLINFVVDKGLSDEAVKQELASSSSVNHAKIAREIWLLTLRDIARKARAIARLGGLDLKVPRVRSYRFSDLATPGMLVHIADEVETGEAERYARAYVNASVVSVMRSGTRVSAAERDRMVSEGIDWLAPQLIRLMEIEDRFFESLPVGVLPTVASRFFAAVKLADTLDWVQYISVVAAFNAALEKLAFRSHQLGGADITREDARLLTCMPSFPETLIPTRSLPPEVLVQMFADALRGGPSGFDADHRALIQEAVRAGLADARVAIAAAAELNDRAKRDIERIALTPLIRALFGRQELIRRAVENYFPQFREATNRQFEARVRRGIRDAGALLVPDLHILLEGESDKTFYGTFLELLRGDRDVDIVIEGCEGKHGVVRRARDLLRSDPTAGIVAIFDADARKEKEDFDRIARNSPYAHSYIYSKGAIEDQFSAAIHADAVNAAHPHGARIEPSDLSEPYERSLSKALFSKKSTTFEKRQYALQLAPMVTGVSGIPPEPKAFVEAALAAAERRHAEIPQPKSYLSLDRRTRQLVRALIRTPS